MKIMEFYFLNGKDIDNKMVLQHLDFRENGLLPNPDGRSYRVTRTAGIRFSKTRKRFVSKKTIGRNSKPDQIVS